MKRNSNLLQLSIIIPTFNSGKILRRALESVASQTYQNWEVWIVDGRSTDNTLEVANNYAEIDSRISYISEPDRGIYDAMNKGIKLAEGEWLYFMGSDDVLYSNKVLSNFFEKKDLNGIKFLYGNKTTNGSWYGGEFDIKRIITQNINHQCIFYHKTLFQEIGNYEIKSITAADYLFNMKVFATNGTRCHYIDETVANFGTGGASSVLYDSYFDKHLEKELLDIFGKHLPKKDIYPGIANSAFAHLHRRKFHIGLRRWFKVVIHSRCPVYYFWNGLYWIKERLKLQLNK